MQPTLAGTFPAYTDFAPRVPVYCVTPGGTGYIHRYYDSSPFSPSGRYFAVTRLPFEIASAAAAVTSPAASRLRATGF